MTQGPDHGKDGPEMYGGANLEMRCPSCYRKVSGSHCLDCDEMAVPMRYIQAIQKQTHEWRMEKWPDISALAQTFGTAIEVMELGELVLKAEYYDEDWADEQRLKEEAGDALLYHLGVMSLLELDVKECIEAALDKNQARDWDEHQKAPATDD